MNSYILDYQATRNVCKEEMSQIKFSGIGKQAMDGVGKSLVEQFSRGNSSRYTKQSPLHTTIIIQICTQAIEWRRVSCF